MSLDGFSPLTLPGFGGLNTLLEIEDLDPGQSPNCVNVGFTSDEAVSSRAGIQLQATDSSPFYACVDYVAQASRSRLVLMNNVIKREVAEGNFAYLDSVQTGQLSGTAMRGSTYFGKSFFCLSNGDEPTAPPMVYNGTNLRRFTTSGPGAACSASAGGAGGVVTAGYHWIIFFFGTDNGYYTRPSPMVQVNVAAGQTISITNLWTGPPGTVVRRIAMSPAFAASTTLPEEFFYVPQSTMEVADNSTTTASINFSDATLESATRVDFLYDRHVLRGSRGAIPYSDRLIVWGSNTSLSEDPYNAVAMNFDFDGGFNGNIPLSWTQIIAGGSKSNPAGAVGDCYRITGDGATLDRGTIESGIMWKANVVSGLQTGTSYGVRLSVRTSATAVSGRVIRVGFINPSFTGRNSDFNLSNFDENFIYLESTSPLILSTDKFDASTRIRIGMFDSTALSLNDVVDIQSVELFEMNTQSSRSTLYISDIANPEAFTNPEGIRGISVDDGQSVRDCFVLRDNLYAVKDHSFYSISDPSGGGSSTDYPNSWPVTRASDNVGGVSVRSTYVGDGFAVIFSPVGIYRWDGGIPEKISDEIEPTTARIDWYVAQRFAWITVDADKRIVYLGVPGGHFDYDTLYMACDYRSGWAQGQRKWSRMYVQGAGREIYFCEIQSRSFYQFNDGSYAEGALQRVPLFGGATTTANDISGSNDFAFPPWVVVSGTGPTTVTAGQVGPFAASNATRWTWAAPATYKIRRSGGTALPAGSAFATGFIAVKPNYTGTLTVGIEQVGGSGGSTTVSASVGPETVYRLISVTGFFATGGGTPALFIQDTAGLVTHDMYVCGDLVQRSVSFADAIAGYFQGYAPGGETASGWMGRIVDSKPYDWCADIDSVYETGPFRVDGDGDRLLRGLYGYIVLDVKKKDGEFTTSVIEHSLVFPNGSEIALPTREVTNTPIDNPEIIFHYVSRWLRYKITNPNYWLAAMKMYAKAAPYASVRGRGESAT